MKPTLRYTIALLLVAAASHNMASAHDREHEWRRDYPPMYQREPIRQYNYIYYPAQQVYYSPDYRTWYWANGAGWQFSNALPYYLNVDMRFGGVPVILNSARPYSEHLYVEQTYGRPWRESREQRYYRPNERRYEDRHEWREHHREGW